MNAARKGRLLVWSENVNITNVEWVQDRRGRCALELRLDGRSAHFDSSQRSSLLDRGIVAGISYLSSERRELVLNPYVQGSYGPAISSAELVGCTDDAGVFTLFETARGWQERGNHQLSHCLLDSGHQPREGMYLCLMSPCSGRH
jgi:hypothetical protein